MEKKKTQIQLDRANVVGAIHTEGGFSQTSGIDAAEVRVDLLPTLPSRAELSLVTCPIILTVRRKDEGGGREWSDEERSALYAKYLARAAAIDLELRSLGLLSGVVEAAQAKKRVVIASYHDFEKTPTLRVLRKVEAQGRDAGVSIVKIATKTEKPADVARLLELLEGASGPLSVMGMGHLGRASRLLFAKAGSVLNYGWLDQPQVPGQWSAQEFGELLRRA
jgi:3-dehydroquinate dehydratase-1